MHSGLQRGGLRNGDVEVCELSTLISAADLLRLGDLTVLEMFQGRGIIDIDLVLCGSHFGNDLGIGTCFHVHLRSLLGRGGADAAPGVLVAELAADLNLPFHDARDSGLEAGLHP